MKLDRDSVLSNEEKLYMVSQFLDEYPKLEIQDLYKWLYYGEFGYEEGNTFLKAKKQVPKLQQILDEIQDEKLKEYDYPGVWKPMGCAHKFVMVYLTPYAEKDCPLLRIVNLMERSPAFSGSRMQFKLDWGIIKEFVLKEKPEWNKDDFYQFEDRIGFHQLPILHFTDAFHEYHPFKYRVVSQKLFFDYFPEFYDSKLLSPPKKEGPSIG